MAFLGREFGKRSGKKKVDNRGTVACPPNPIDTSSLVRGDFVILKLEGTAGAGSQLTWARVRSLSPKKDAAYLELVGEFTSKGILPIKFGFSLGETFMLPVKCIWDILRDDSQAKGQILCGPQLAAINLHAVSTKNVQANDVVQVAIASQEAQGTAWHEVLEVRISTISPTSQILHGIVVKAPTMTLVHGLSKYSALQFGRDCVVGI
jgi:hypothetical protein